VIVWFLFRRSESGRINTSKPGKTSLNGAQVGNLLATADKALSEHSASLRTFERSLRNVADEQHHLASLSSIRHANQCVVESTEETIAGLVAACGDLLSDEQSTLEAYRERATEFDATLGGIKHEELLIQIASSLLGVVRNLRAENEAARDEVAAGKDKIIELLTRASSAEQIARIDTLTQLLNRRAFDEAQAQCEEMQSQSGQPYSVVLLDIDHFKSVNDKYGHPAGDAALSLLGRILRDNCKTSDHGCRLGGEEFALLLPRCLEGQARSVAEAYRQKIESAILLHGKHRIAITVSCGVAQAIPGASSSDVLSRADAALYAAKTRGRNQTVAVGDLAEQHLMLAN
jgi:diguanylate cyclase (GGDEF)-like protein